MTVSEKTYKLREVEERAKRGDLARALSLCEGIIRCDRSNKPAFNLYRRLFNAIYHRDLPHAEVFDFIYASNMWFKGSGLGSLPQTTETYRHFLQDFLSHYKIRTVVDAGCGDWQFSKLINWSGIDYLGVDVSSIVIKNIAHHAAPNVRFVEGDIRIMPQPGADLLIMKDVLQHWPNDDIQGFIPKFAHYRYCLVTNGMSAAVETYLNKSIPTGNWRPVDLALPPFSVTGEYIHTYDVVIKGTNQQESRERKRVFLIRA